MSRASHSAYTPRAGDRVRLGGFDGPRAVVLEFRSLTGQPYFKARRLDTHALVWPDGAVADSEGTFERTCAECEIRFRTDQAMESLCGNCGRQNTRAPDTRRATGARWWRGR
jgi:hypothetical protein